MLEPWEEQDTRTASSLEAVCPIYYQSPVLEIPGPPFAATTVGCKAMCCCRDVPWGLAVVEDVASDASRCGRGPRTVLLPWH